MPIYEYQCTSCGHHMETLQKTTEKPLKKCPNCRKTSLKKLISASSFQLKGTGWYVTDFRDKNKPAKTKTEESAAGGSTESVNTEAKSGTTEKAGKQEKASEKENKAASVKSDSKTKDNSSKTGST